MSFREPHRDGFTLAARSIAQKSAAEKEGIEFGFYAKPLNTVALRKTRSEGSKGRFATQPVALQAESTSGGTDASGVELTARRNALRSGPEWRYRLPPTPNILRMRFFVKFKISFFSPASLSLFTTHASTQEHAQSFPTMVLRSPC